VPPSDFASQTVIAVGKAKTRLQQLQDQPGQISRLPQLFDLFQPAVVKDREQKYEKYIRGGKKKKRNKKVGAQMDERELKQAKVIRDQF
jgi:hypothetical protein